MNPTIVALFVSTANRVPLTPKESVQALENRGIDGDRHAKPGSKRAVLIMPAEILDQFGLAPGDVREQVTIRGLDIHALPDGARLHAGTAVMELLGPCAPCERMEELKPGLQLALEGRRGRFARVVTPGTFAVGDTLAVAPAAAPGHPVSAKPPA
ncbi:MAG TPA: MOSC domain-containing protein [Candidatus Udaeobacter sp.]|jgi:MOSC domain-containing protein YiiM|nr:MOSC domain-containing protein [Candidatus Udaeobacter sp.]